MCKVKTKSFHLNILTTDKTSDFIPHTRRKENIKHYIPANKDDVVDAAHRAVRHGGRDILLTSTSLKYTNVTKQMINFTS